MTQGRRRLAPLPCGACRAHGASPYVCTVMVPGLGVRILGNRVEIPGRASRSRKTTRKAWKRQSLSGTELGAERDDSKPAREGCGSSAKHSQLASW